MNRRSFIQSSFAAVSFSALPLLGATRRTLPYKTALIGSGWWGMNIVREALASGECKITALVDVDTRQLKKAQELLGQMTSDQPRTYHDYRAMLQKEQPEIVIVATPDLLSDLCSIAATEAGAQFYVGKPIGQNINEGIAMSNVSRKNNRILQVGTHRRVCPHNITGMEFLKSGRAGKIGMARAFVHYG